MDTLVFILSKLVGLVIRPDSWLILGLGLGVLLLAFGRVRAGRRVVWGVFLATLALAVLPVGDLALRPLESRYPVAPALGQVDGILVLGGAESGELTALWGQVGLNDAAERMTAGLALARAHPGARLLFTGGSGSLRDPFGATLSGAEVARQFYAELGLAPERLVLEDASRTTAENARLSLGLAGEGGTWVLVTSAFHMPRAMASFRAAGWPGTLVAWPVDHRGGPLRLDWDLTLQLEKLRIAVKEYVGLLAYRLLGRG